ncbi:MAG: hypothetical protein LBV15_04710, partial [Planctomycetota bacterium]|nr:hypothetical protein [Planctomycetota bacterium]
MNDSSPPLYAGVVVEAPLTRIFHYRVPEGLTGRVQPGDRADVIFSRRRTRGVVVELSRLPPIDPSLIRELLDLSPEKERIPGDILELTRWTSEYYRCGWGTTLAAAVPAGVKLGRKERVRHSIKLASGPEQAEAGAASLARRAPRQAAGLRAIMDWFKRHPASRLEADSPDIRETVSGPLLRQLAKRGLISLAE